MKFGHLDVHGHLLSEWYVIVIGKQTDDIQQVRQFMIKIYLQVQSIIRAYWVCEIWPVRFIEIIWHLTAWVQQDTVCKSQPL